MPYEDSSRSQDAAAYNQMIGFVDSPMTGGVSDDHAERLARALAQVKATYRPAGEKLFANIRATNAKSESLKASKAA